MRLLPALGQLGANPDTITISGYSLGAYMAQDIANIWSKDIKGLGFVGAAPYYNEAANDLKALYVENKTPKQMADKSEEILQEKFKQKLVEDPKYIKQQRVY